MAIKNLKDRMEFYLNNIHLDRSSDASLTKSIENTDFGIELQKAIDNKNYLEIGKAIFNYKNKNLPEGKIDQLLSSDNPDLKLLNDFYINLIAAVWGSEINEEQGNNA